MDESVKLYLKEINKIPDLSEDDELRVVNKVLDDDSHAADLLAESNMKRVALMALDYQKQYPGLDLFDIIQAGNTGLLRAVQSYTPGEYRFWEYAVWWVRNGIEDFIKSS